MTRHLPPSVQALLGRDPSDGIGETMLLAVAGADGWPHIAMLGVGEVLAPSPARVLLALHAGSGTTAGVLGEERALLIVYAEGQPWRCRLDVVGHREGTREHARLVAVDTRVRRSRPDVVPYATVTGWIQFELAGQPPADTVDRWRRQHHWLREQFT